MSAPTDDQRKFVQDIQASTAAEKEYPLPAISEVYGFTDPEEREACFQNLTSIVKVQREAFEKGYHSGRNYRPPFDKLFSTP